jgi:anti-anti-sigma factor
LGKNPVIESEYMKPVAAQQISFEGRIGIDNSNAMRNRLGAALKLKPKQIEVDLSRVTSVDISGLATLVEASRIARHQGTQLRIGGIQGQVQLLFAITRLDQILEAAAEAQSG